MNKSRRGLLSTIGSQIEDLKAQVETLKEQEQNAFDSLPEGLQCTERGQVIEEAVAHLDTSLETLQDAIDAINDAAA